MLRLVLVLGLAAIALSAPTWTNQLATVQQLSYANTGACQRCTKSPCVDLREGTDHHHVMWLESTGRAKVSYCSGSCSSLSTSHGPWTCTSSSTSGTGLVGTWSCPGFYGGTVTISSSYGDDFTSARTNDHLDQCSGTVVTTAPTTTPPTTAGSGQTTTSCHCSGCSADKHTVNAAANATACGQACQAAGSSCKISLFDADRNVPPMGVKCFLYNEAPTSVSNQGLSRFTCWQPAAATTYTEVGSGHCVDSNNKRPPHCYTHDGSITDENTCKSACTAVSGCSAYEWGQTGGYCQLIWTTGISSLNNAQHSATTGSCSSSVLNNWKYNLNGDSNYAGGAIQQTYHNTGGKCYRKEGGEDNQYKCFTMGTYAPTTRAPAPVPSVAPQSH